MEFCGVNELYGLVAHLAVFTIVVMTTDVFDGEVYKAIILRSV